MAAAGRDAAGRTEAAGVTVALPTGQGQRHDGVDLLGNRKAALLHLILRKLTVRRDLDARTLQGGSPVWTGARR